MSSNPSYQSQTPIQRYDGENTGRYIVTFKEGIPVSRADLIQQLIHAARNPVEIAYEWDHVFNGFAAKLDETALHLLQTFSEVESISEDGIMHECDPLTQTDAPWGLARLSADSELVDQKTTDVNFSYTFDTFANVDIYIVDTGVRVTHIDFGGRARWAAVFGGYDWEDRRGHGTHVAGTAAGNRFGTCKDANIWAVKVLGDNGRGASSDIIAGLNYVLSQYIASGRRRATVVNMSLGGRKQPALDSAVRRLISEGIHVVVAAGNQNKDAENHSPARVKEAITVGASTIADSRASFSNYGSVVNLFAPGKEIISLGNQSDTATAMKSGTSMASPHVAGLVAYLIKLQGNVSPAVMAQKLAELALKGVLSDIPSGTPNLLAHNAV